MGGIGLLLFLATVVESANGYNILFSRTKALENSLVLRPRIPSPFRTMSLEKVGSACSPQTLASSALKISQLIWLSLSDCEGYLDRPVSLMLLEPPQADDRSDWLDTVTVTMTPTE